MTKAHQVKLTEIVSYYPISEKENLGHIDKVKEPSEDVIDNHNLLLVLQLTLNRQKHIQVVTNRHRNNLQTLKGSRWKTLARNNPLMSIENN